MKIAGVFILIFCLNSQLASASYKIIHKDGKLTIIQRYADSNAVTISTAESKEIYDIDDIAWFYLEDSFYDRKAQMNKIRDNNQIATEKLSDDLLKYQANIDAAKQNLKELGLSQNQKDYLQLVTDKNQKLADEVSQKMQNENNLSQAKLEEIRQDQIHDIKAYYDKIDLALSPNQIVLVQGLDNLEAASFFSGVKFDTFLKSEPLKYKASCKIYRHDENGPLYMKIPVYSRSDTWLDDACSKIAGYKKFWELDTPIRLNAVRYLGLGVKNFDGTKHWRRFFRVSMPDILQEIGGIGSSAFIQEFHSFEMPD